MRLGAGVLVAVLALALWGVVAGPCCPVARLDLGALALDQARLREGLSPRAKDGAACPGRRLADSGAALAGGRRLSAAGQCCQRTRAGVEQARAYWVQTPLSLPYLLTQGDASLFLGKAKEASALFADAVAVAPTSSSALRRIAALAARRRQR